MTLVVERLSASHLKISVRGDGGRQCAISIVSGILRLTSGKVKRKTLIDISTNQRIEPMLRTRLRNIHFLFTLYRAIKMMYKRKRYGLKQVHKTFFMNGKSIVSRDLIAHEYSGIGEECYIGPNVELGPYAMLGPRVAIIGGDHRYDIPGTPILFSGRAIVDKTTIGADVWIGYGAIVMAGTTIGRGAIIGAGSVVLKKKIDPYEVYMGVPARRIFDRFPNPSDRKRHDEMLADKPREGEWPSTFIEGVKTE